MTKKGGTNYFYEINYQKLHKRAEENSGPQRL